MAPIDTLTGLRLRPYAGEPDLAGLTNLLNAEAEADGIERRATEAELRVLYGFPNEHFDPARDVTIAEVDGRIVAHAEREWIDTTDGLREYRLDGAVDPEYRGRGIGATLLADSERQMRALAATHDTALPRVFGSWSADSQARDARLLTRAGFEPVRWFFDMTRPNLDDIPDVPLPDGLELRPITRDLALHVWRADVEAFRDHWGGFDGSDDRLEGWLARPYTDLSMWVIAFDGDEVAGGVLNTIDPDENAALGIQRGWLSSVFTRRQWRRRGVARALIARSLALHRERGMTSASLGVDADNPSGALGLYEGTGFKVDYRSTAWRKAF
jgi:mycothiol synthase